MLTGSANINGKTWDKWSAVRKELRKESIRGHVVRLAEALDVRVPGIADADAVAPDMLADAVVGRLVDDRTESGWAAADGADSMSVRLPPYLDALSRGAAFMAAMATKDLNA
eukprot:1005996-Pyramimonas_sp.AAC.1